MRVGDLNPLYRLEGWLANREGDRLCELASEVPAGQVIVELGSYRGKSACFLAHGSLNGNRRPVYCVDLWALGGQWETDTPRRNGPALHHDDPAHYEAFRANTDRYRDLIVEVNKHSHQAGREWKGGKTVGLLFIDADHSYNGVMGDLTAWMPHMAPGGVVAIHDYVNDDYPDIRRAVDEYFGPDAVASGDITFSMLTVRCAT